MREIKFDVSDNLLGFVCRELLEIGTNPCISIVRTEDRIGKGKMMRLGFEVPSRETFVSVTRWLRTLGDAELVFDVETKEIPVT